MQNLILLTVDAWRADFESQHAGIPLTPTLDRLTPRTVAFDAAYASGPWTSPGLISIFTGEDPAQHNVHYEWSAPRPGGPALAETLRSAGYAVPNLCYLNRVGNYQNLGYSTKDAPDYPKSPDDDRLLRAISEHGERPRSDGQPFFFWYHYKFIHLPYWAGREYRELLGIDEDAVPKSLRESVCARFVLPRSEVTLDPALSPMVRRLYAAGVRQFDAFLARLVDALEASGLAERTTLVITSDHGDELLEHGHVGHASTAHHATVYDEVLRMPLLFIEPRATHPGRRSPRVYGADLFPTLLSLAGLPAPPPRDAAAMSRDLSPLVLSSPDALRIPERTFFFQSSRMGYQTPRACDGQMVSALSDGRWKVICERFGPPEQAPVVSLYDLSTDPGEQHPLRDPERIERAAQKVFEYEHSPTGTGPRLEL